MYTKPRHEKKVSLKLTELGIPSYLPTTRVLRTWCDRRKFIETPLFPSYVFTSLEDIRCYYDGLDVEGVLNYVKFGKEVARVSVAIIDNIKLLISRGSEIEVSTECFQPGRQLYIQRGPLTGLSGEIIRVNGNHKILVRVHLLQRNLLVTVPADDLIAISA